MLYSRHLLPLLVYLAACGSGGVEPTAVPPAPTPPPTPQPVVAVLSFVAGEGQKDSVRATLPVQMGAMLRNATTGDPLPGRIINWKVVEGEGSVAVPVTQTASDGVARQSWTLGSAVGMQKLTAVWLDPETGAVQTIDTAVATAGPGAPVALTVLSADTTVLVGQKLSLSGLLGPLKDQYGNTIPAGTATFVVSPVWQHAGDLVWADAESQGAVVVQASGMSAAVVLNAVEDVVPFLWTMTTVCGEDRRATREFTGGQIWKLKDSTSSVYTLSYHPLHRGTVTQVLLSASAFTTWTDGRVDTTVVDAVPRILPQDMATMGLQRPDSLRFFGPQENWGTRIPAVTPDRYVVDQRECGSNGSGRPLTQMTIDRTLR